MSVLKNKKVQISAGIFFVLGIIVAVVIIFAGNDYTTGNSKSALVLKSQEGFTFFDFGVDSELTNHMEKQGTSLTKTYYGMGAGVILLGGESCIDEPDWMHQEPYIMSLSGALSEGR